jgi:hypothetical protein
MPVENEHPEIFLQTSVMMRVVVVDLMDLRGLKIRGIQIQ